MINRIKNWFSNRAKYIKLKKQGEEIERNIKEFYSRQSEVMEKATDKPLRSEGPGKYRSTKGKGSR